MINKRPKWCRKNKASFNNQFAFKIVKILSSTQKKNNNRFCGYKYDINKIMTNLYKIKEIYMF